MDVIFSRAKAISTTICVLVFMICSQSAWAESNPSNCSSYESVIKQAKSNAKYGSVSSLFVLGKIYYEGKCINRDLSEAEKYFTQAAANGHSESMLYMGLLFYQKSPKQDFKIAIRWFKKALEAGDTSVYYYFGEALLFGRGVKKDFRKAEAWLRKADVKNKDARAQYLIGYLYQKGITHRRNYRKAFSWYVKSALQGYNHACYRVASFYERGIGVRRNRIRAYTWYTIAEKFGYKQTNKHKERLLKALSNDNIARAQKMINRYMETITRR